MAKRQLRGKTRALIHGDDDAPLCEQREGKDKLLGGRACDGPSVIEQAPGVVGLASGGE